MNERETETIGRYAGVIFDLDGTLLDTLEDLADSVNYALASMNMPLRSTEEIRAFVGNGVNRLIHLSVKANTTLTDEQTCLDRFKRHYEIHMYDKTKPYNGMVDLLEALKKKNIKMAVVSNKYDAAVKELCKKMFPAVFLALIGESETVERKPAADGILEAARQMGVELINLIYVGDTSVDIQTAQNAGIPCIGATWGFRDRHELEQADYIVEHPSELLEIILASITRK